MFYQLYELNHAILAPWRAVADVTRLTFQNPLNPLSNTDYGRSVAAAAELFERTTRRYGRPDFGIETCTIDGKTVAVHEETVWHEPFCNVIHFRRDLPKGRPADPRLLIVAPLSGHYSTLLRGTVETMLLTHDVYITDWVDARMVPLSDGTFDLDDYIDYLISMLHCLGQSTHVMAVCQPSVPVLAAVAMMDEDGDPYAPATMTLMGGPVDTRENPTGVNKMAEQRDISWFRNNVIVKVPFPHPGFMRQVYPGFLQLTGFMSMNLDRHMMAHQDLFRHLVDGDGDSAEKHRDFYDEYLAVMDLSAEFYLQTVETVFHTHALPKGEMMHRGRPIRPQAIHSTGLLTIEGENDDISGIGQTRAAHKLCTGLSADKKEHYEQPGVGHYGVFNGSRFRKEIAPKIAAFTRKHGGQPKSLNGSGKAIPRKAQDASERLADAMGLTALRSGNLKALSKELTDLTDIAGIGPKVAEMLNEVGIFEISQLAEMSADAIGTLDNEANLKGRALRDDWIGQARKMLGEKAKV